MDNNIEFSALPEAIMHGAAGMTTIGWVNTILSLIAIAIIVWKLSCYSEKALWGERIGTGLIGTGMMLLIAQIMANSGKAWVTHTPFEGWSTSLFRIGLIMHFGTRIAMHRWNNVRHVMLHRAYISARDKAK